MKARDLRRRLVKDPALSAERAGLNYATDASPGIRRLGSGKGFRYVDPDGAPIRDKATLDRIRALAIPPAYRNVWISPDPDGHLQAVGFDDKGRKQYRYHPDWHRGRGETKFTRTLLFGETLPKIRAAVEEDISPAGLGREKVLAAVVRLLERTRIRVGNEESARELGHYGLTTMQNDHLHVHGGEIDFSFVGKSGVEHDLALKDLKLARMVKRLQDLPGQDLFQFKAPDGSLHRVTSGDVNAYIKEISGEAFTAKDFRTWAGTVLAAVELRKIQPPVTKKAVAEAVKVVAHALGNTPAVCRAAYIHPAIIAAATEPGGLAAIPIVEDAEEDAATETMARLRPEEKAVLRLLKRRLAADLSDSAKLR